MLQDGTSQVSFFPVPIIIYKQMIFLKSELKVFSLVQRSRLLSWKKLLGGQMLKQLIINSLVLHIPILQDRPDMGV